MILVTTIRSLISMKSARLVERKIYTSKLTLKHFPIFQTDKASPESITMSLTAVDVIGGGCALSGLGAAIIEFGSNPSLEHCPVGASRTRSAINLRPSQSPQDESGRHCITTATTPISSSPDCPPIGGL